jgi:hypothetical protein
LIPTVADQLDAAAQLTDRDRSYKQRGVASGSS